MLVGAKLILFYKLFLFDEGKIFHCHMSGQSALAVLKQKFPFGIFKTHICVLSPNSLKYKGKCKGVPVHAVRACRGSEGIAPFFLNLGTRWRLVVN
jgi:hypothetical protein